jgi:hypothetical protein
MNKEQRTWWQEVADQYREWADGPPRFLDGYEMYTCIALRKADFGWWTIGQATNCLKRLWAPRYGRTDNPAGRTEDPDRDERRFGFCHHMADVIEDWLENGELP